MATIKSLFSSKSAPFSNITRDLRLGEDREHGLAVYLLTSDSALAIGSYSPLCLQIKIVTNEGNLLARHQNY